MGDRYDFSYYTFEDENMLEVDTVAEFFHAESDLEEEPISVGVECYIHEENAMVIKFDFGRMLFNEETAEAINEFNIGCAGRFCAAIMGDRLVLFINDYPVEDAVQCGLYLANYMEELLEDEDIKESLEPLLELLEDEELEGLDD